MSNQTSSSNALLWKQPKYKERIKIVTELLGDRLPDLLAELGVRATTVGKIFIGTCPVHGGDNFTAFNMYKTGHSTCGNWLCNTQHCEKIFRNSVLGFIRGMLSVEKLGWSKESKDGQDLYSFDGTILWACDFLGIKWDAIDADSVDIDKTKFINWMKYTDSKTSKVEAKEGYEPGRFLGMADCPAEYFIKRGFSADILKKHLVGVLKKKTDSNMDDRAVVPVFNHGGDRIIGFTGRSLFEECGKCGCYHAPALSCPTDEYKHLPKYAKWANSKGFDKEHHLYNIWNAKAAIKKKMAVIIVEGPGDVWRLEEAGIDNAVAIMGASLTDRQQIVLEECGASTVMLLLDKDSTGINATNSITERLRKIFKIVTLDYGADYKDVGQIPSEILRTMFLNKKA